MLVLQGLCVGACATDGAAGAVLVMWCFWGGRRAFNCFSSLDSSAWSSILASDRPYVRVDLNSKMRAGSIGLFLARSLVMASSPFCCHCYCFDTATWYDVVVPHTILTSWCWSLVSMIVHIPASGLELRLM